MSKNIVMIASENDALPRAKVGGIGDVMRDIPRALVDHGCSVHCIIPSYGHLHLLPHARRVSHFPVEFGSTVTDVSLYALFAETDSEEADAFFEEPGTPRVFNWVLHHPGFYPNGVGNIYCNDPPSRPFATDATKFALFSAACGQAILNESFGPVDILHLHDWHAAIVSVLREYSPHFARLKNIPTVYSVHNLAIQGIRPFAGDASSLEAWFPFLRYDRAAICDPRVTHCFNPMRAAIQLCTRIHAVSPTYAQEVQEPSDTSNFKYGGEGLEGDLATAAKQHRLIGILNGCEYPQRKYRPASKTRLVEAMHNTLLGWMAKEATIQSAHWIAQQRIKEWAGTKGKYLMLASVGRLTEQKVRLLRHSVIYEDTYQPALVHLLAQLEKKTGNQGVMIILGTGQEDYERFFTEVTAQCRNLIYLQGFSPEVADMLYNSGDLFFMPSSYEPCGISQMLAMRAGQPCLAHGVGGLNDTIRDGVDGFLFHGSSGEGQVVAMLERSAAALTLMQDDPARFAEIKQAAAARRFDWNHIAQEYLDRLYS